MYDEDLTNLEDWLRRLKVEYDIFFHGNRKKPPDDLKMRVDRLVKKLSEVSDLSFQERFRYNTLVGRLCVYRDLWRRTIQEKELALKPLPGRLIEQAKANPESKGTTPEAFSVSIVDPLSEEDKVRKLYEFLLSISREKAKAQQRVPFRQFAEYIARQTHNIMGKFGCSSVIFSIGLEADSVRFTARPGNAN